MIIKHFNLDNKILEQKKFFLLYGNNEGLKNQTKEKLISNKKTLTYDESEILNNKNSYVNFDSVCSLSG